MADISFRNLDTVLAWLAHLPEAVRAALMATLEELAASLQSDTQAKLGGAVLQSRSGRLRDAIDSAVEATGQGVSASVFVSDDVPYAAIQEYGGVTKAHIIEAAHAKTLTFALNGKQSFFAH